MAFGNFWRGRERFGGDRDRERDRDRDRWRTGGEWREAGGGRGDWREGYAGDRYREQGYGSQRGYGSQSGRDWEQGRGGEQDRDWRSQYSSYGRDLERDYPSRSSYGAGSEGSDWDYVGGTSRGGQHRGKGPRGYRRSDARIHEDLCDCLTEDPFLDASEIEVKVEACEVTLTGTVSSRDDKRRAEDLAESISGVNDVRNNLRVSNERGGERSLTSGQSAADQTAGQRGTGQPGQTQQGQTQQGQQTGRH